MHFPYKDRLSDGLCVLVVIDFHQRVDVIEAILFPSPGAL